MANTLLTIDRITNMALRMYMNSNSFIKVIDRQFDDEYGRTGAKIGDTLRIRLPNDYTVQTGATATPNDTSEQNTSMTVATQKNTSLQFSSYERALKADDYARRYLKPAVNAVVGAVAADVMSGIEGGCSNIVFKTDGSGNILTPDAQTWLLAGAKLDINSAPNGGDRLAILDPLTQARTISSLAGLFNPAEKISKQYQTAMMGYGALGFDWLMDQTVIKHTNGTYSAGTVNGANQTGSTITVNAITGTFNKGDIITFAGVFAVNRVTKQSTGELQQFTVTANVANGATSIPIYPALIPGAGVQYQTVTASPANAATITLLGGAGVTFRKNFVLHPEAVTMATAQMEIYKGIAEGHRASQDNLSLRIISDYLPSTDQLLTRLDILYGYKWIRPEWICAVADVL